MKEPTKVASPNQEKEKKYAPIQHKPCQICGGKATGFHFGVISCEACKVQNILCIPFLPPAYAGR